MGRHFTCAVLSGGPQQTDFNHFVRILYKELQFRQTADHDLGAKCSNLFQMCGPVKLLMKSLTPLSLFVCLSLLLCLCLSLSLSVCLSICLWRVTCFCLSLCLSLCISVSLCSSLSFPLSLALSLSVSVTIFLFFSLLSCSFIFSLSVPTVPSVHVCLPFSDSDCVSLSLSDSVFVAVYMSLCLTVSLVRISVCLSLYDSSMLKDSWSMWSFFSYSTSN